MFKWEETTDSYGQEQTEYWLTQGDSCAIFYTPNSAGEPISDDLISKIVFKIGDSDYNLIFEKELEFQEEQGKYLLLLTSEETSQLAVDSYKYEIEYTFTDGDVQTTNQSNWHITQQIKRKGE